MAKKIGKQTIIMEKPPVLLSSATVAGPKEGMGPLAGDFDLIYEDLTIDEKSFEKAEVKMLLDAFQLAVKKASLSLQDIDFLIAGDLLNQIIASGFAAREMALPFWGLYGACSSLGESLSLASLIIEGGSGKNILIGTSSHNCTAERQFRYPTEYGAQRAATAQWTVTGAGAAVVAKEGDGPYITTLTVGIIKDFGLKDPNDLGSAMAPAAASTIEAHFKETGRKPSDYDLIVTGDLGQVGKMMLLELMQETGYAFGDNYTDCGLLIYYPHQKVDAGGSGCACSSLVTLGHLLKKVRSHEIKRLLLVPTGALHSPTSYQQQESIPGIAHAVLIESKL